VAAAGVELPRVRSQWRAYPYSAPHDHVYKIVTGKWTPHKDKMVISTLHLTPLSEKIDGMA
jgi:hypothetical protein